MSGTHYFLRSFESSGSTFEANLPSVTSFVAFKSSTTNREIKGY